MKAEKRYKIKNGNLIVTNSQIKVKYELLVYFSNALKVFGAIALMLRFKSKIENLESITGFYENKKLVIFGLASLTLFYFFIDFVFKSIWKNSI